MCEKTDPEMPSDSTGTIRAQTCLGVLSVPSTWLFPPHQLLLFPKLSVCARDTGHFSSAASASLFFFFFFLIIPVYFLKCFKFYIGVQLINSVVLVSGIQQRDSVIHIHVSLLFQILFLFRLI